MGKRTLLLVLVLLLASVQAWAQSLTIQEASGWLESAYVKWLPSESADSYNVYYSGEGIADKQIDKQLIRSYGPYYRADVLGLKPGSYTLKIVPVLKGVEGTGSITETLTVTAHDRSGYAFWNNRIPGAYKADGTPKDGAVVLYITEKTRNIISLDVTGATSNPCVGLQTILDGFKKGVDSRPLIVRLVGQITDPSYLLNGDIVIENDNYPTGYITIEGVGDDAVADGWGIRVKNASNIEVSNVGTMNCNSDEGDNIGLQQNNDHIWVHNCDFFYGNAGSDADQIKGDGALDCKKSTYVTFSYNHFWDTGKSNLLGLSEGTTTGFFITYHHNWYDHSDSRHPRVRYYSAHVYNNYYDGIAKYGVGSTMGSSVFVEANYFRNCKYPMLISMQGSDVFNESTQANDYTDMPTFSKEDGGIIKAWNNYITGQRRFVQYGAIGYPNSTVDFDAYMTTSRNETLSSSVVSSRGGNTYNNFDTNSALIYVYTPDSPEEAKVNVMNYAGRINGGDFKWTFNNAVDDAAYDVNAALKTALSSYKTKLVSVQGDSTTNGGDPDDPGTDSTGIMVQNFTESGMTSTFYSITGNLSDSKGSVTYSDLLLTQCLKMESSTLVSFTTTKVATLTLVFNTGFTGSIKVDGTSYNAVNGILTLTIQAGQHNITKGDVANIYYISVVYSASGLQPALASFFTLYPNPFTTSLHLFSDIAVDGIEVYNIDGVLVFRAGVNVKTLDLTHLTPGNYLVKVITGHESFVQKVVKFTNPL